MPSTINASTSAGIVSTADTSGILQLQSNGTTKATVDSTGLTAPTVVATTLSDGTNSTSSTNCIQGSAKAWVYFNGVSSVTVGSSYNVSSVVRNSAGYYTVNFTNNMANNTYSVLGSSTRNTNNTAASTDMNCVNVIVDQAVGSFIIKTGYPAGVNTTEDSPNVRCAVFA